MPPAPTRRMTRNRSVPVNSSACAWTFATTISLVRQGIAESAKLPPFASSRAGVDRRRRESRPAFTRRGEGLTLDRDDLWAEVDELLFEAGCDDTEAPPSRS